MNKLKSLQVAAILMLLSSTAGAATDSENQTSPEMPMMNQEQNGMMMTPEMMHKTMPSEQYHNMPMMNPQMMHMMMHGMMHGMNEMHGMGGMGGMGHGRGHTQNCDMPMAHQGKEGMMMNQGKEGMMMNPQMMQMRMQHMTNMEQRLENIEALLSQLVELQKAE